MGILKTLTINGVTYNVTPVVPASSVTLLASAWKGDGDKYSQVVTIPGVTSHTKVDLQPTSEQLIEFHYKVLAFVAENDGGEVTVFAIGDKPMGDHTIQITKTEVEGTGKIRGNTVGTTMPRPNWNQTDRTKADYILKKPENFDVYAAWFDCLEHYITEGSFDEMVSAFDSGKIVTLSTVNPIGGVSCYYCVNYTPGGFYEYDGDILKFQLAGDDWVECLIVESNGKITITGTDLTVMKNDINGVKKDLKDLDTALDAIIEIQNSLIGGDGV